jgi:hypothetical protein
LIDAERLGDGQQANGERHRRNDDARERQPLRGPA